MEAMDQELIELLENRINDIVEKFAALKEENARLQEELRRFSNERVGLKSRVDHILGKLEGI
jgi:cell division protein ZapB